MKQDYQQEIITYSNLFLYLTNQIFVILLHDMYNKQKRNLNTSVLALIVLVIFVIKTVQFGIHKPIQISIWRQNLFNFEIKLRKL